MDSLGSRVHMLRPDPSDARKTGLMRSVHRAWEAYAASGHPRDAIVRNASVFMLKNIEHKPSGMCNAKRGLCSG